MDIELFPFISDFMMSEHKFLLKNRKSLEKGLKIFISSFSSVLKTFQENFLKIFFFIKTKGKE
jgi:hypothetical protein